MAGLRVLRSAECIARLVRRGAISLTGAAIIFYHKMRVPGGDGPARPRKSGSRAGRPRPAAGAGGRAIHFYGRLTGLIEGVEPLDEEPPPGGPVSVRIYPVESFSPRRSRKRKP